MSNRIRPLAPPGRRLPPAAPLIRIVLLGLLLLVPGATAGRADAAGITLKPSRRIVIGADPSDPAAPTVEGHDAAGDDDAWIELDEHVELGVRFDFQRVDGLAFGLTQHLDGGGPFGPQITLEQVRAFNRGRWLFAADFEQPLVPRHLVAGGGFYRSTALFNGLDSEIVDDKENLLAALLVKRDYRDYYEDEGIRGHLELRFAGHATLRTSIVRSLHRALANSTRTSLTRWDADFRPNPSAGEGTLRAYTIEAEIDTRPQQRATATSFWYRVQWERAGDGLGGDFHYGRILADLRHYWRTSPGQRLSWRLIWGSTRIGEPPAQKRFAIGGIGTLRAHQFKELTGEQVLLGNVEYRFDLDADLMAMVFLDSGATADRDASLTDRRYALDGGFGLGFHGDRAVIHVARDLRRADAAVRLNFRLSSTF